MAQQGNYVTVPTGSAPNPYKGLGDALTGLSGMFADRATSEEEQRRWESGEARRVADDKRKEYLRKASWDTDATYQLSDYSPEIQADRQRLLDIQASEQAPTLAYLNAAAGSPELAAQEKAVTDALRENLAGRYSKNEIAELVRQRTSNLAEYRRMMHEEGADRDALQKQLVTELYENPITAFDKRVAQGIGLTKAQQEKALLNRIPEEYRGVVSRSQLQEVLAPRLTGRTRDQLIAQESKRIEDAHARQKDEINAIDKYYQRANAGRSTVSGYKKGGDWSKMAKALSDISQLNIGWFDNDDARLGFDKLIEEGVNPEIAASAILFGVDRNMFGASFPDVDSKDFAKLQDLAIRMNTASSYDSKTKRIFVDPSKYRYKQLRSRTPEEILRNQFRGDLNFRGKVPVSKSFRQKYRDYSAKNPVTTISDDTTWGRSPKAKVPSRPSQVPSPPEGTAVGTSMSSAEAEVLGQLPENTQIEILRSLTPNARGRVSEKGKLSRTYLEQAANIQKLRDEASALYADPRTQFTKEYAEKKKALNKAKQAHEKTKAVLRPELAVSAEDKAKIQDMQKRLNTLYSDHRTRYSKEYIELKKELRKAKAAQGDRL